MQHLAIIPDGNRRWAKKHMLETIFGHKRGMEVVRSAINVCIRNGIRFLSFYTFSLENFNRPNHEQSYLFDLLINDFPRNLPELITNGVRVKFIGDRSRFPAIMQNVIAHLEEQTQHLTTLQINLLFCYGATAEIVSAVQRIAQQVKDGVLDAANITEETVYNALWTNGIPNPELIIRTGGVMRLSNFLLMQAAYSEFAFVDDFWPDITEDRLQQCLLKFTQTQRNFGH